MSVTLPPDGNGNDKQNGLKKAVNEFYSEEIKIEELRLRRAKERASESCAGLTCSLVVVLIVLVLIIVGFSSYRTRTGRVSPHAPVPSVGSDNLITPVSDMDVSYEPEYPTADENILSWYPVKWERCAYQPSYWREDIAGGVWCWSVSASGEYANGNKYHLDDPAQATVFRAFITDDPTYFIVMDEIGDQYDGIRVDMPETTWELFPDLSKRDGLYYLQIEVIR